MKKKSIHFVGIKGVGMTPLAIIAKEAGCVVTGSDIDEEFITDAALKKAGIKPFECFASKNINNQDLVITTGAHGGFDNIEVKAAREKNIKVITQGEAVGLFMEGILLGKKYKGVSVAGTHGKTTTSAMIATILKENSLDPSFVVGTGNVVSLGAPGHFGRGNYFIAEADEYVSEPNYDKTIKFLWQHPTIAVITNIEFDHPDVYSSIEQVREAFLQFVNQLPQNGVLIVWGDDREIKKMLSEYKGRVITYGFNPDNNYVLKRVHISGEQMFFWVNGFGTPLGEFAIRVVGEHNSLNALAAILSCLELGVPVEKIKKGLMAFQGSKRRLEYIGELTTGAKVYDDYAHHPTEIKKTLYALRTQYPKKRILCVFQPHTYSRTKILFNEFLKAFEYTNSVIVTDIYASLREEPDPTVSSRLLVDAMKSYHRDVEFLPSLSDVVQYIGKNRFRSDTVLVTMGAGDVYKIHAQLAFI